MIVFKIGEDNEISQLVEGLSYNEVDSSVLEEAVITFNGKAYPKNNSILILAGGGGSGKGFALSNMIAFEGKHLDVDEIKERLLKFKEGSEFDKKFYALYKKHLKDCDLKDKDDVQNLHEFSEQEKLPQKINSLFFNSQAGKKDKSNVIFDVTLKGYPKYKDIMQCAVIGGYRPENIHIVWVLNNIETAKEQNAQRARNVEETILTKTHEGVAEFFKEVFNINQHLFNNFGDIYILFTNTKEKDNKLVASDKGGKFMDYINYIKIKEAGKKLPPYEDLMNMEIKSYDTDDKEVTKTEKLRDKINRYIPASCDKF